MSKYKDFIKTFARRLGYEVCRVNNSPVQTLCGMRHRNISSVVDVGANTGQFAKYILKFFPQANIYCFEPLSEPFRELRQWSETQTGRVRVYNIAVGDSTGTVQIHSHADHSPSSSILASTEFMARSFPQTENQTEIVVDIDTLDSALSQILPSMKRELLLKLDVQGYEDRVLRGAQNVLAAADICILEISLENFYKGQADYLDLMQQLYASRFRYAGNLSQSYANDGSVLWLDAVFKKV